IVISFCLRKFIARLPDKGKKISDFAEKVTLAILQEEEVARTAELLSAARLEFQGKQEEIIASKQVILNKDTLEHEDSFIDDSNNKEIFEVSSPRQKAECVELEDTNTALENERTQRKNYMTVTKDQNLSCEVIAKSASSSHLKNDQQNNAEYARESTAALDNKDALVV
ncbi:GRL1A polymerase, partial [Turnix velox]|nr:GRL1A polymerase [Turnix velox]